MSLASSQGWKMLLPVPPGRMLPDLPASGFSAPADALALPGARVINQPQPLIASPDASSYVFLKTEIRRNLFRIQLR